MEYIKGKLEDVDNICRMIQSAIKTMKEQGIDQWDDFYPTNDDFISDIQNGTLYTVTEQEKLVAIYVISEEYDSQYSNGNWEYNDDTTCIIHRLCVSSEFQNHGVGKTILLHIEDQLRELGYESVRLDVFSKNPYALRLYENHGYIKRGHADWRKGRFFLMEKKL